MGNELSIIGDYPSNKYNSLIPITTIQQVSDMHKVIVNQVKLSKNEDAYFDKYANVWILKKVAILKLMAAANIRIIESKAIPTQSFKEATEMARAIGKVVEYDKRDVAHQVTLEVPDMNGGYRPVTGTKEIVFSELPSDRQTKEMLKHKRAHCETKALLRALRAAMMLKSGYQEADFDKPFIVAIIVPNTENEEVKQLMINKMAASSSLLFGSNEEPMALTNDFDDSESSEVEIINEEELPVELQDNYCNDCGQEILGNTKVTKSKIIESSNERYGVDLCVKCINARHKKEQ